MFQSPILDVAVGVLLLFLVLSLICTPINEAISRCLGLREELLWRGLCSLFQNSPKAAVLARKILDHDMVDAISPPGTSPNFIPPEVFSLAVVDILDLNHQAGDTVAVRLESARSAFGKGYENVFDTLKPMANASGSSLDLFRRKVEDWFNSTMRQAQNQYRVCIQVIAISVAFLVCVVLNADTFMYAQTLWSHPQTAASLASEAQRISKDQSSPVSVQQTSLQNTGGKPAQPDHHLQSASPLPVPPELQKSKADALSLIGWSGKPSWSRSYDPSNPHRYPREFGDYLAKLAGLLVTAIAASLGSAYWYKAISQVASLRAAGQSSEGSNPNSAQQV